MPTTGSTTRSKAKTQKSGTAVSTPKGSRTGTDGSSVQIPIWASTAKIDQLEDLSIDSSDDENDGQPCMYQCTGVRVPGTTVTRTQGYGYCRNTIFIGTSIPQYTYPGKGTW